MIHTAEPANLANMTWPEVVVVLVVSGIIAFFVRRKP